MKEGTEKKENKKIQNKDINIDTIFKTGTKKDKIMIQGIRYFNSS